MDAPYNSGLTDTSLKALHAKGWMKSGTLCVVEVFKADDWQPSDLFEELDVRIYGVAKFFFLHLK